jgi:hypothetical protein
VAWRTHHQRHRAGTEITFVGDHRINKLAGRDTSKGKWRRMAMVFTSLTALGWKDIDAHQNFHEQMVQDISRENCRNGKTVIRRGLSNSEVLQERAWKWG